ncbi:kelch repeat and BTB domain-containing protein 8-like [Branchiostoma floridae x Branchiostoma japonicum]
MAAAHQEPHVSAVRPRSYQDESYLHGFLGTVGDLQKAGALQDVVLEVEDRRFPCHRLVLSAASPYFRAMFTSDMAESQQKTVVLQGLDAGMFGEILSYIYSGTLHVSLDKGQPLYQAADLLQLDYVRDTCSSYMVMNVERSNCVDLYKFADVFSVENVRKTCLKLINRNFEKIAFNEEFCSLSVNQLTEIISHDELDVKEETTVWEAVVRWVQHSREDRLHHLPSILPHIRFNLLTSDDTVAILEHPLVREDPGSSELIRNVVQKGNSNLKPRLGMTTEMVLLFDANHKDLLFMNPREGKYISSRYKSEDFLHERAMTVTSDNNIYILTNERNIGCYHSPRPSDMRMGLGKGKGNERNDDDDDDDNERERVEELSVLKYNHARNVFEQAGMSSVSKWRPENDISCADHLVEVDGILYYLVVDLEYGEICMRKYNRHTDQWQECSQQLDITNYEYYKVLSCGSHLYVLKSTELHRYDPSQDRWCKRTPPGYIPQVCTAVAMGTEIFCTDIDFSQTIVYDTESDRWQKLEGRPNPGNLDVDDFPELFALENHLHIVLICTSDSQEGYIYLVFEYDRSAGAWRDLKATLPSTEYYAIGPHWPVARIYLPYLKGA